MGWRRRGARGWLKGVEAEILGEEGGMGGPRGLRPVISGRRGRCAEEGDGPGAWARPGSERGTGRGRAARALTPWAQVAGSARGLGVLLRWLSSGAGGSDAEGGGVARAGGSVRAGPPGKEEIGPGGERREGLLLGRGKRVLGWVLLGWVTGFVFYFSFYFYLLSLFKSNSNKG